MNWYKIWNGMPEDAKWRSIAKSAGCTTADVLALWLVLLDCASRNRPRGQIDDFDAESLAALLDLPVDRIEDIINTLRQKRLLVSDNKIAPWERMQKTSTRRVRAFRKREAAAKMPQVDIAATPHPAARLSSAPATTAQHNLALADTPAETALRRERLRREIAAKQGFHRNRPDQTPSPRIAELMAKGPIE